MICTLSDRKHDQVVRDLTKIQDGQCTLETMSTDIQDGQHTIKRNQELMLEKLSSIQNNLDNKDQSGASADAVPESVAVQETERVKKKLIPENSKRETANTNPQQRNITKLSPEMPLEELWAKQGFRDEFSNEMNVKYNKTNAKHWPYLAEEFGIDRDKSDEFATSCDYASPSESMFQALERKKPYLTIEELCFALKSKKAYKVLRIIENAIEAKAIEPNDLVSDMCDDAPESFEQVVLNLDKRGVWRDVAKSLDFAKRVWQSFERDMDQASNLARDLFDVLRTHSPKLRVRDFERELEKIDQQGVLKVLADRNISGDMLLRELSEMPDIMLDIEHILNDPQDMSLWQLAERLKRRYDINLDANMFRHRGNYANPTYHLMEHVLARHPEEQTIKDLVIKLINIDRQDCLGIIGEYLEGGEQEVEDICREIKNLQIGEGRKVAAEQDKSAEQQG